MTEKGDAKSRREPQRAAIIIRGDAGANGNEEEILCMVWRDAICIQWLRPPTEKLTR